MKFAPATVDALKRPVTLIGAAVVVVVVVVWLLAFFLPQGKKLTTLQAEKTSLQQAVTAGEIKLKQLRSESQHTAQIRAMYNSLQSYAPATVDIYTYIQTLSNAAKSAGVSITSLGASTPVAVSGTSYSDIPITATVKGTYDQLLAFIHAVYTLPRLTDVNSLAITGGGPGANRTTILSVNLQLAIFTSQSTSSSG